MRGLLIVLAVVLGFLAGKADARMSGPEQYVFDAENNLRASLGLNTLGQNDALDVMAQDSADTCANDFNVPYLNGRVASMNGWGFNKAPHFWGALSLSPEHRAWLVWPPLLEFGVGKHGDCWTVVMFWRIP